MTLSYFSPFPGLTFHCQPPPPLAHTYSMPYTARHPKLFLIWLGPSIIPSFSALLSMLLQLKLLMFLTEAGLQLLLMVSLFVKSISYSSHRSECRYNLQDDFLTPPIISQVCFFNVIPTTPFVELYFFIHHIQICNTHTYTHTFHPLECKDFEDRRLCIFSRNVHHA